jgi:hypothetical protein
MYQNSACPSTLVGYVANVDEGHRVFQGQWKIATDQKPEMIMVQKRNAGKEAGLRENSPSLRTLFGGQTALRPRPCGRSGQIICIGTPTQNETRLL